MQAISEVPPKHWVLSARRALNLMGVASSKAPGYSEWDAGAGGSVDVESLLPILSLGSTHSGSVTGSTAVLVPFLELLLEEITPVWCQVKLTTLAIDPPGLAKRPAPNARKVGEVKPRPWWQLSR